MSTYTSSLGLEQITPGDQAGLWGNTTNNNLSLVDQAVTGVTTISFAAASGSTYTLTDYNGAVDEARSAVLNITGGATGSNTVVVPNKQKTYLVRNNTGQDVIIRTASPTASFTVGASFSILVFCDGNNSVFTGIASPSVGTLAVTGGGTGVSTFGAGGFVKSPGGATALTSSSAVSLTADVSGVLPVTNGGTGAGTFTSGSLLVGNGTSNFGTLVGGAAGQVATWSGSQWTAATPASGAVTSVTGSGITVSPTTGSVVVSLSSGNVTSALGYTPASLSSNQSLTGTYTWAGASTGDQKVRVDYGGYTSGLSNTTLQLGTAGIGVIYDPATTGVSYGHVSGVNATCFTTFFYVNTDNTQRPTGGPWISPSDQRLKENITTYTKGLSAINALRPVNYILKGDLGEATKHKVCTGLIAQEVLNTPLSSMIGINPDGHYSLDANEVTWALVNSVKELKAELDTAKAEIAALKAK